MVELELELRSRTLREAITDVGRVRAWAVELQAEGLTAGEQAQLDTFAVLARKAGASIFTDALVLLDVTNNTEGFHNEAS